MEPVRSSLGGGIAATFTLLLVLLGADILLAGTNLFVFATFTSLCAVGGPPYCELGTPTAAAITFLWFGLLFAVAWPLLFGGFTWGLPGGSGLAHGAVFGLILWSGYVVGDLLNRSVGNEPIAGDLLFLAVTLVAYLIYGVVLGGGYDFLAEHRTFLSDEQTV
jgi:hypothetical protein